jgi:hypothetical protein
MYAYAEHETPPRIGLRVALLAQGFFVNDPHNPHSRFLSIISY